MKYTRAFLTGCDYKYEWLLPWFFKNYLKYNKAPLVFADFGLKDDTIVKKHAHAIIDLRKIPEKGWFKKPKAMLNCPAEKTVWIDTDCQVLQNIESIFSLLQPNKLNMVEDKPWTKRRGENGAWYNSGVVGYIGKPPILKQWADWILESNEIGDQEVLYERLDPLEKLTYINPLPNEYNWLRVQIEHDDQDSWNKKVVHWTGYKGKKRIMDQINA